MAPVASSLVKKSLWMLLCLQILEWQFALKPQFSDEFKQSCSSLSWLVPWKWEWWLPSFLNVRVETGNSLSFHQNTAFPHPLTLLVSQLASPNSSILSSNLIMAPTGPSPSSEPLFYDLLGHLLTSWPGPLLCLKLFIVKLWQWCYYFSHICFVTWVSLRPTTCRFWPRSL